MDLTFVLLITVGLVIIAFLLAVLIASMREASHYRPSRSKASKKRERNSGASKTSDNATLFTSEEAVQPKPDLTPIALEPVAERVPEPEPIPEATPAPMPEAEPEETVAEEAPSEEDAGVVYPPYSNQRAIDQLGLSQEEADAFVAELIGQIDAEVPNLEAAVEAGDFEQIERVSHMLKGSATSLGEGGIADQLVEFNTYCKHGTDITVIHEFMQSFYREFEALKLQFGE